MKNTLSDKYISKVNNAMNLMQLGKDLEVMGLHLILNQYTETNYTDLEEIADALDLIRLDMAKELYSDNRKS